MKVKDYTKDSYRLSTRFGQSDEGEEVLTKYINGLEYAIQYELSISNPR